MSTSETIVGEGGGKGPRFALRDVGLLMLGLPAATTHKRFENAMRLNGSARANYNRLKVMLDRMQESDALRLYDKNSEGTYDVAEWIDKGVLPSGERDPKYSFGSDATKKNQYTTLVMMSTEGKCCDELASRVSENSKSYFKTRLAQLAKSIRKDDDMENRSDNSDVSWNDILNAYENHTTMTNSKLTPEDILILDWWLAGGNEFPPMRHHFGNVMVSKGKREIQSDQDYLYFKKERAFLIIAGHPEIQLPESLSKKVKRNLDADGKRWRKWLFQSRSGKVRPVENNTFGYQVKGAFKKLTGKNLGINQLLTLYSKFLASGGLQSPYG